MLAGTRVGLGSASRSGAVVRAPLRMSSLVAVRKVAVLARADHTGILTAGSLGLLSLARAIARHRLGADLKRILVAQGRAAALFPMLGFFLPRAIVFMTGRRDLLHVAVQNTDSNTQSANNDQNDHNNHNDNDHTRC